MVMENNKIIKQSLLSEILCCTHCRGDLYESDNCLICKECKERYDIVDGIPIMIQTKDMDKSTNLSFEKWNERYESFDVDENIANYHNLFEKDTVSLLSKGIGSAPDISGIVLEIGCGYGASRGFWHDNNFVYVGLDFSLNILRQAKKMNEFKNGESLFICGDLLNPPFKKEVFDLIWGAGVIEHFEETLKALKVIRDIQKVGGRMLLTFPYLSMGALTYRQVWGNIPDMMILRDLAKFVHINIFKEKFMQFGFEYSFTETKIRKLIKDADLQLIDFGHHDIHTTFDYFKNKKIKDILRKIEKVRLFWAMAYLIAEKNTND